MFAPYTVIDADPVFARFCSCSTLSVQCHCARGASERWALGAKRCLAKLAGMGGVTAVGGVRDPSKAAKKLAESKIEIRGAMIEKGAAIDASPSFTIGTPASSRSIPSTSSRISTWQN